MNKKQIELLYNQHTPMLHNLSHQCSRRCGRPEDEVFGQACFLFMRATETFDSSRKTAFGTHLYRCVHNGLLDWARKYDLARDPADIPEQAEHLIPNPRKALMTKEWLEGLSNECREVANIILNGPAEVLNISEGGSVRELRGALWSYLRNEKKWSRPAIWRTFNEMKQLVAAM